jgi:hypothetical protein
MFGLFRRGKPEEVRVRLERRQAGREPVALPASLIFDNDRSLPSTTLDLSRTGARLSAARGQVLPAEFTLSIPDRKLKRRVRLVWRGEGVIGVEFI